MPTASKFVAAVYFAALAYFCADLVKPLLPEGTRAGLLNEVLVFLGILCGWNMSGKRAGDGMRAGFGYGLTTSVLIAGWGIFFFAGYEALELSVSRRYHGPMEAIRGMIGFMIDYAVLISTKNIVGTLFVGGLFGGWLVEGTAKRWS
ncbi:MAG: TrgA family protein [Marinosulfonomonas sp.]|nr:TrgA family protein [Marinosulfonomonas sp.]